MKSKELKKKEAEQRNLTWSMFTPEQQLSMLEKSGIPCDKQKNKIRAKIKVAGNKNGK